MDSIPAKSAGQLAYERDLAAQPTYHDGRPRVPWDRLCFAARWSWERNPTDRFSTHTERSEP